MANEQRERATLDMLFQKRKREKNFEFEMTNDDGDTAVVSMLLRAIGRKEYDSLITAFPPTQAQKKDGASYDLDRFAPALLARVVVDPALDIDSAKSLWQSEDWNRGELFDLFRNAVEVCNVGTDLDPTEAGSE